MHRARPERLRPNPTWLLALALAGCAGGGVPPHEARRIPLSPAQKQLLVEAEKAYRAGAPEYPEKRAAVLQDPAATAWFVRMLTHDLFTVREGRQLGEGEDLLRAAAKLEDALETKALAEIAVFGAAAVPTLVDDLLCHQDPMTQRMGIELVGVIGAAAVPEVRRLADSTEARHRRVAGRTFAVLPYSREIGTALRRLSEDRDFTVRADAMVGLRGGDGEARGILIDSLRHDEDRFVRRAAAKALGGHRHRDAAAALLDYLDQCDRATKPDPEDERAAQGALQQLAGSRGPRTPAAWRNWFASWQPTPAGQ